MKEQPAWLAAALKSLAVTAAGATAAVLAKGGVTLDAETIGGLVVVYVGIESIGAGWLWSKVAPLVKLKRVAPDAHAAYMAATRKP